MKKSQNILQVWLTKLVLAQRNRWQRFSKEHCEDAEKKECNKYDLGAQCFWLADHNDWSRWFAISSPPWKLFLQGEDANKKSQHNCSSSRRQRHEAQPYYTATWGRLLTLQCTSYFFLSMATRLPHVSPFIANNNNSNNDPCMYSSGNSLDFDSRCVCE